jgi:hypothetical protein
MMNLMFFRTRPLWQVFVACTALMAVSAAAGVLFYSAITGWSDVTPRHVLRLVSPSVFSGLAVTAAEWRRRRRRAPAPAPPVLPERI